MRETIAKIKNCKFIAFLKDILCSKYFPFVNAAMTLLCYYLGLDIVLIYYIVITGSLIFILCDDLTPVISLFIFIGIIVSSQNSPSVFHTGGDLSATSDYYFRPAIYIQIIVLVALCICSILYRLCFTIATKKVKLDSAFYCLAAFCVALLMNGLFRKDYDTNNLLFAFILCFLFLGVYTILRYNIAISKATFEKIAFGFLALSLVLIIELLIKYCTTDGLIIDGNFNREKLTFGWGIWNTMGMMLTLCLPSVVYLAYFKKYSYVFTAYSVILFVSVLLSCSRQSIIGALIIYPVCIIILLVKGQKGKNKIANLCIFGASLIAGITVLLVFKDTIVTQFIDLFKKIVIDGELSGSGRTKLWREAISYFKDYPVFGSGFFVSFSYLGDTGIGFIPLMCHNTILELLSACGIIGLVAYTIHRAQTILSFFKNVTIDRAFIALTIIVILFLSLFDNHLFNVFPTLIYSSLLAVFTASEKKYNSQNENLQQRISKRKASR